MVIGLKGSIIFLSERTKEGGGGEASESSAPGHRDVMMGRDELGFAGGLPSVLVAGAALQGQCFNPHRADLQILALSYRRTACVPKK